MDQAWIEKLNEPSKYWLAQKANSPFENRWQHLKSSPLIQLLFWIWDVYQDKGMSQVRKKIGVNYSLSIYERETLKVVGKRSFSGTPPLARADLIEWNGVGELKKNEKILKNRPVWAKGRMEDASGNKLLFESENQNGNARYRHAEILLVEKMAKQLPPDGAKEKVQIEVSLSPCRMCAAWIEEMVSEKYIRYLKQGSPIVPLVVFHEKDTGRWATGTRLEGLQKQV